MNIILFKSCDQTQSIPLSDLRAQHILKVLNCQIGDTFHAGVINGPSGRGTLTSITDGEIGLCFAWTETPQDDPEIIFLIGLPRPQTARKILNTLSTLGASALHFVQSDKSDLNYATSKLWTTDEWSQHLIDGAQQAFTTRIPEVRFDLSLYKTLKALAPGSDRIALDNYEGQAALGERVLSLPLVIAIGPEQGWSDRDRDLLIRSGFRLTHLGQRILRVETACISAMSIARSMLGLM
ncbi:MAG: RsmE family RNA methyltransferase [bacterium]|nr:RsmE family RNA methyltransferase [bacterium]